MNNMALKSLMESMNAQIAALNQNDFKIYDEENRDFFITGIRYDREEDKIIFLTESEEN